MKYYISDLHFFHNNVNLHMDMRGFEDLTHMHEYMVKQWNSKVRENDEVYILGDFSIGSGRETNEILRQLRGKLHLIVGNHDKFLEHRSFDASRFQWILPYKEMNDNKRKVILCHYPIICYNGQYRRDKEGNPKTYMLYGHVHNTYDEQLVNRFQSETRQSKRMIFGYEEEMPVPCQMINCFCMFSDYKPLSLDEWIALDEKRRNE